ncbi:gamma-glutamyltransferase family protein [Paraburkholderia sp.]|uniref:gamma-glutamyltransferase family protein n=1 Tax=Paraburkholderia sp. TaxID=1926495 RepID=UPI0039E687A9
MRHGKYGNRTITGASLLATSIVLASCGGGISSGSTTTGPAPASDTPPESPPPRQVKFDPTLCTPQANAPYGQTVGITGTNMMVTSADINASAAGCKILATGGTAIDAAIAVQGVLAVVEPFASGLGGGSLITYYDAATQKVRAFDGLAAAPSTTGGVSSIYQAAVADDLKCKSGLKLGDSLSAWQGNTNISGRATGVPGTLKVLDMVHQAYGKQPWNALWTDAINYATNGFPMSKYMYSTLYNAGTDYDEDTGLPLPAGGEPAWINSTGTAKGAVRCKYTDIHNRYCDTSDPNSALPLPVGTTIRNPQLATTLAQVRDGGAAAFYDANGPIVAAILARFAADKYLPGTTTNNCYTLYSSSNPVPARIPSLMTAADFTNYRAVERKPLSASRFGTTVYTQPAPSFGGTVVLYTLGLLERKNMAAQTFGSEEYTYLATEASRLANIDRRTYLGDPAYSNTDARVQALLADSYLDSRAALMSETALPTVSAGTTAQGIPAFVATDPATYNPLAANQAQSAVRLASAVRKPLTRAQIGGPGLRNEDFNTTSNVAIIDGYGNALSMTTTINTHWGAHIEAAGMMLNDALSNFSAGAVGSDVNGLAPDKRPRTSISPSLAFDGQNRLRLVWGSAGGGPIPDYIVKAFLGNVVFGQDLQASLNADNWSGQDSADSVAELETGKPIASMLNTLTTDHAYKSGTIALDGLVSGLSGIAVSYDANGYPVYSGAADNRRNGSAYGY